MLTKYTTICLVIFFLLCNKVETIMQFNRNIFFSQRNPTLEVFNIMISVYLDSYHAEYSHVEK